MTVNYAHQFSPSVTPQKEKAQENQIQNNADGYVFELDDWKKLDRFISFGTEGGSYYVNEKALTKDNAKTICNLIKEDGIRVVNRITEISQGGKVYKNDTAIFVLALTFSIGDTQTKKAAELALPLIARTGTHLFTFLEYVNSFRGWGRGLKRAVANWYQNKPIADLEYQVTKYVQRNGWSHSDALKLSHPKTKDINRNNLYKYIVGKRSGLTLTPYLQACEDIKTVGIKKTADLIKKYNLPREVIPTEKLTEIAVWEALLGKMPMTAMIRNLATMTRIGVLKPMSKWTGEINRRLINQELLKKARIHPIQILSALLTYASGRGVRSSNEWDAIGSICDALDKSFYLSFGNVEPTNKRLMLALDVSGSMGSGMVGGVPNLTPRVASGAMALITASTESNYMIMGFSDKFVPLSISPRQRLDDVYRNISNLPFEHTDCAIPMVYALKNQLPIDAFIVYTDSETWFGKIHPFQALRNYRKKMQIPAKLIVVGMVANDFTIADPSDAGMLDVVGFNTDTPNAINDFIL